MPAVLGPLIILYFQPKEDLSTKGGKLLSTGSSKKTWKKYWPGGKASNQTNKQNTYIKLSCKLFCESHNLSFSQ